MAITQTRPKRKESGGRYKDYKKKEKHELGKLPAYTKLEAKRLKILRTIGNNRKARLLSADLANVFDPKTKKYAKLKIKTILENPANRHFIRRNIMSKGSVIETEKGKARVTSRPGQDGTVNAVLIA